MAMNYAITDPIKNRAPSSPGIIPLSLQALNEIETP